MLSPIARIFFLCAAFVAFNFLPYAARAQPLTLSFLLPLTGTSDSSMQWLPYSESGFNFEDVYGSTGHVSTYRVSGTDPATGYLALGDWYVSSTTSSIRVSQGSGQSFGLSSLNYVHDGEGWLRFESSKGGILTTPQGSSSGPLSFSSDPLWQDIANFTITGFMPPSPSEFAFDEAIITSMTVEAVPEPQSLGIVITALSVGVMAARRRRAT